MLIKSADDKTKLQALLEDLQKSPLLALPDFMKPKAAPAVERLAAPTAPVASEPAQVIQPAQPAEAATKPATAAHDESLAKKLICAHCRAKISYPEGKFCWNNAQRFADLQYCREHQGLFE